MSKNPKPQIKLFLTKDAFNTFFTMLTFFVASEAQAGETFYSYNSKKMMNQFVNYGSFVEKKDESDNLFIILLYENELIKIMQMYGKYVCVHQKPNKDYYTEFIKDKKSQS